jgi:hypothetical protein
MFQVILQLHLKTKALKQIIQSHNQIQHHPTPLPTINKQTINKQTTIWTHKIRKLIIKIANFPPNLLLLLRYNQLTTVQVTSAVAKRGQDAPYTQTASKELVAEKFHFQIWWQTQIRDSAYVPPLKATFTISITYKACTWMHQLTTVPSILTHAKCHLSIWIAMQQSAINIKFVKIITHRGW